METHRLYLFGMFTNVLLHPHHIIPAVELVATLRKAANHTIPQVVKESYHFTPCTSIFRV